MERVSSLETWRPRKSTTARAIPRQVKFASVSQTWRRSWSATILALVVFGFPNTVGASEARVGETLQVGGFAAASDPTNKDRSAQGHRKAASEEDAERAQYDEKRCQRAAELAERGIPLPYNPTSSTELVYLRVAGVRYAIPANYFRYPPVGCDSEEGSLLLRVRLPDFEPSSVIHRNAIRGASPLPRMFMNLHLKYIAGLDMDRIFSIYARGVDPLGEHHVWDTLSWARQQLDHPYNQKNDIFFHEEGGRVAFFLRCGTRSTQHFLMCSQFMEYRGALLTLDFGREHLGDWREFQNRSINLFDIFFAPDEH